MIKFRGEITPETGWKLYAAIRDCAGDPLVIEMDSIGGDYLLGVRCYQELTRHKGGTMLRIVGKAESVAVLIAMGADRVEIAQRGQIMIHHPRPAPGETVEHDLTYLADQQAEIYAARTGIAKRIMVKWLARERRMSAAEAVRLRFCDALIAITTEGSIHAS